MRSSGSRSCPPLVVLLALVATSLLGRPADATPLTEGLSSVVADLEVGPLRVFQNDGRYGAEGTLYTAGDVGQRRLLFVSKRASLEARFLDRHTAILLYAPLDVTTRVTLDRELVFRDRRFSEGETVDHRYLFDGFRGSYLYQLVRDPRIQLDVGASLQIRNAQVAFTSLDGDRYASENDIGLVFALKARLRYTTRSGVYAQLDGDGFSTFGVFGVDGALLDLALTLGVPLTRQLDLFARLRYVGGGAEVPRRDLFNWAHLGAALIGARANLEWL